MDDIFLAQYIDHGLGQCGRKDTQQEVEPKNHRLHPRKNASQETHQVIGDHICSHDQSQLDRQLIHDFLHGHFIFPLDLFRKDRSFFQILKFDHTAAFQNVEVDDPTDTGAEEAQSRNSQTKHFPAFKAVFIFVDPAVVQRLPRSLSEAEG